MTTVWRWQLWLIVLWLAHQSRKAFFLRRSPFECSTLVDDPRESSEQQIIKVDRNRAWAASDLRESQVDWWRHRVRWALFNSYKHLFVLVLARAPERTIRDRRVSVEMDGKTCFRLIRRFTTSAIYTEILKMWISFPFMNSPTHYMIVERVSLLLRRALRVCCLVQSPIEFHIERFAIGFCSSTLWAAENIYHYLQSGSFEYFFSSFPRCCCCRH